MLLRTFAAVAALLAVPVAEPAYAQAGSGASAPATVTTPTPSGDKARTPTLGDPGKVRPRPRTIRAHQPPPNENGNSPDRAAAAGGAR